MNNGDSILGAMSVTLEEGQEWSDVLTLTLRRDEWAAILAATVSQGVELRELLDELRAKAESGDFIAMLVGPQVHDTAHLLGSGIRQMTEMLLPAMAAEAYAAWLATQPIKERDDA